MRLRKSDFDKLDELMATTPSPNLHVRQGARVRPEFPPLNDDDDESCQRLTGWWLVPMALAGGAIWAVVLF